MIIKLTDRPDNTKSFAEVSYPIALGEELVYPTSVAGYYVASSSTISVPSMFLYYMPKDVNKITRYDVIRRFSIFTMDSVQKEIGVYLVNGEQLYFTFPTLFTQGFIPLNSLSQLEQYTLYTFYKGTFYDKLTVEMYNRPLRSILEHAKPSIVLNKFLPSNLQSTFITSNLAILFAIRPLTDVPFPIIINGIYYQPVNLNVEINETYLTRETSVSEARFFAKLYKPIVIQI
jgi:hypothetical protein